MNKKRALPTPRNEGKTNVLEATVRLLKTHNPGEITLGDISLESGHGPRLMIEWFGSKGGLLAAAATKMFADLANSGDLYSADVAINPDVTNVFKIFNHMLVNHPDELAAIRPNTVTSMLETRIRENLGKSEEEAAYIVRRFSVLILGLAVFREFIGVADDEAVRMFQDEFRATTGVLLADNRSARSDEA